MAYELRVGTHKTQFETEPEAVEAAAQALRDDPDAEPEIFDLTTGKPATPAASRQDRETLKNKIGF